MTSPAGETNATYDDLAAIWDAYNGIGTGTDVSSGTPSGGDDIFWVHSLPDQNVPPFFAIFPEFRLRLHPGYGVVWIWVAWME